MSRKLKIYLDTSVPNAFLDTKNQDRMEITKVFWGRLKDYQVYISDIVMKEINAIGDEYSVIGNLRKEELTKLVIDFNLLSSENPDIQDLADEYVKNGMIPVKYIQDAIHIATATVHSMDVLISWNFEHMVKLKTKTGVNAINQLLGYKTIEIIAPSML